MHCNAMHYLDMLITNITLPSSFQKKGCLTNYYKYLFVSIIILKFLLQSYRNVPKVGLRILTLRNSLLR